MGKMEDDYVEECYEIDEEYEFDAPQFYDFTNPEIESRIHEVERWFQVSGDYPHSPYVVKLNLEKILSVEVVPNSSTRHTKNSCCSDVYNRNIGKAKEKASEKLFEAKNWSFMEPTVSHLAKQCKVHAKHSSHLCTRFQRASAKLNQKNNCSGSDHILPTKRQKLEIGYLKKDSQLKHQFSLSHKSSKKVTVPIEPELETQLRAQRRRSKISCASTDSDKPKQNGCNFKAYPLNRKILQPRSLFTKSSPHLPDFQESKNIQSTNHHSSAKENRLSASDNHSDCPIIEKFTELSLVSNLEANNASQEIHSSAKRYHGKPKQCGQMTVEANITRSFHVHRFIQSKHGFFYPTLTKHPRRSLDIH